MESTRQKKISRLLQKDLAIIFQQDAPSLFGNILFTITGVKVSPDLSVAKVNLSIFPTTDRKELMKQVKEKSAFFRNLLAKKVRHQLRIIPELHFYLDDSADYTDEINRLLKE
jgi:ribosome-binding factor A